VQTKEALVQKHALANGLVQLSTYSGMYVIWRNKEIMAASKKQVRKLWDLANSPAGASSFLLCTPYLLKPLCMQVAQHLVSIHAKLGAITTALLLFSAAIGTYRTVFSSKGSPNYLW
jgi:hypothetical protein